MNITNEELNILKHSLGITQCQHEYRNYFITGEGSADYLYCEALCSKGLMRKRQNKFNEVDFEYIYHVTNEGRKAIENINDSMLQNVEK